MLMQAVDKKTGVVMYQGEYEEENNKVVIDMYGEDCEYVVKSK